MDKKSRCAGAGKRCGDFLTNVARFANSRNHHLSLIHILLADGKHSAEEERQAIQYLLDVRCDAIMIYPRFLSVDKIDDIIDAHSQPVICLLYTSRCV